jgi:uncharacterized membrane protein
LDCVVAKKNPWLRYGFFCVWSAKGAGDWLVTFKRVGLGFFTLLMQYRLDFGVVCMMNKERAMPMNDLLAENSTMIALGDGDPKECAPNGEITRGALEALSGNWIHSVLAFVLYQLFVVCLHLFVAMATFFGITLITGEGVDLEAMLAVSSTQANIVLFVIQGPVLVGFLAYFLGVSDGRPRVEDLFSGFRYFFKSFFVVLLSSIFIFLWSLLFVVPGIIAAYRYSMAYFVIVDDPDCGPLEALQRSKEMMVGRKWKLFCLQLRFLGWAILCSMTLGLGYLWLVPYMMTSYARFYEDVR